MKITIVDWGHDSNPNTLSAKICAKCSQPMEVLSIRRLLNGGGDTNVTFCCVACSDELTIKQPADV